MLKFHRVLSLNRRRRRLSLRIPELVPDVLGLVAELLLNAEHLVILGAPLASAWRSSLDLAGAEPHDEIGDEAVLSLSASVGNHGTPA